MNSIAKRLKKRGLTPSKIKRRLIKMGFNRKLVDRLG